MKYLTVKDIDIYLKHTRYRQDKYTSNGRRDFRKVSLTIICFIW